MSCSETYEVDRILLVTTAGVDVAEIRFALTRLDLIHAAIVIDGEVVYYDLVRSKTMNLDSTSRKAK